jgi:histidine kinase
VADLNHKPPKNVKFNTLHNFQGVPSWLYKGGITMLKHLADLQSNLLPRLFCYISRGEFTMAENDQDIETGQLDRVINQKSDRTDKKQAELKVQLDACKDLFEMVPCFISVQDRDFRIVRYNREFSDKFSPMPGEYCYSAYKGRNEKCQICPVEKTFEDGKSHWSEESGLDKNGETANWLVKTAPIKNSKGEIIAGMEMCLDITHLKHLEEKLKISEKRYHEIFNSIPNPVFVLEPDTFEILDCNGSVETVYGYPSSEIIYGNFLDLFRDEERDLYASRLKTDAVINQARHITKKGNTLFVLIRISPLQFGGQNVLLVTTSDITKRLETEQMLIQASKMATLGEMAAGVAHELNQPLSVIKTASSFLKRKVKKKEAIQDEILLTMAEEIDSHVDRSSKIINHLREFGRKSEVKKEEIIVNDASGDRGCERTGRKSSPHSR